MARVAGFNEGFDNEGTSVRQEDLQELQDRAPGLMARVRIEGKDVDLVSVPRRMPRLSARLGAI
jgi:hypothetical protein